jgi:hypothetical protein
VQYVSEQLAAGAGLAADIAKNSPSGADSGADAPSALPANAGQRGSKR